MKADQANGGRGGQAPRRQYLLSLLLGTAGAGLALLALHQSWAHVLTRAPAPLPSSAVAVSGQALVPLAGALSVAALAGIAAVIATRGVARRVIGGLLAAFALAIVAAVSLRLGTGAVLAAAHSAGTSSAGSVTGSGAGGPGGFPGGAPDVSAASRVVMAAFPWRWVTLLGAAAICAAGVLTAWCGPRWPGLSSRYEPPPGRAAGSAAGADSAAMWESLTRGMDPTDAGPGGAAQPARPDRHPSS